MDRPSQPARWLIAALIALVAAALAYLLIGATDSALAVWARLEAMPGWVRIAFLVALGALGLAAGWLIWRILHPRAARAARAEPIVRERIEARIASLPVDDAAVQAAQAELADSDRRRTTRRLYVALFGDISAGKSALMSALSGAAVPIAVTGGTTREVRHADVVLHGDELALDLADVPGTNEVDGERWATLARTEAGRAHALIYVADGEPTRAQDAELRRVGGFGKPLLLALNKSDRYAHADLAQLLERLRARYGDVATAVLPIQAGGVERLRLENGDMVERPRAPRLQPLIAALREIARMGPEAFEPARERAVLAGLDQALSEREVALRAERSAAVVKKYTRRAVIGALAAVAPGTDLIIQGALATAMVRELTAIHALGVRDIDIDGLIERAGGLVRTTTSITLAIAGNALKAFPGLGTIGGGLLHAVAYGLVFDSLGRAVSATLAHTASLDREATLQAFEAELKRPGRERLDLLIGLARDVLSERTNSSPVDQRR